MGERFFNRLFGSDFTNKASVEESEVLPDDKTKPGNELRMLESARTAIEKLKSADLERDEQTGELKAKLRLTEHVRKRLSSISVGFLGLEPEENIQVRISLEGQEFSLMNGNKRVRFTIAEQGIDHKQSLQRLVNGCWEEIQDIDRPLIDASRVAVLLEDSYAARIKRKNIH